MIPVARSHLFVAAVTHPGLKGKDNEDRFAVSAYKLGKKDPTPSVLAVVADGVGGHRAGEVAAEMAAEIISQAVASDDGKRPIGALEQAFLQANQAIHTYSQTSKDFRGMGTTCACAWVVDDRLYSASVGDSRIYLVRDDSIHQLTTDHTWVQEAIESGALTPEQARNHPNAHVIRRHLGSPHPVVPDLRLRIDPGETDGQAQSNQGMQLLPDDQLLLCSDGLTDLVDDEEILNALKFRPIEEALNWLVDLANARGGHDNITIVALQVPAKKKLFNAMVHQNSRSPITWFLLGLGAFLITSTFIVGSLLWVQSRSNPTPESATSPTPIQTLIQMLGGTATPTDAALPSATSAIKETMANISATPETSFQSGSATPIQATYTPWPTSTQIPPNLRTPTRSSP